VVDPYQLTFDIAGNTISLLFPAALWALLFLLAWEHTPFAESIGFGRWAFWLLLPGAILASFAILPIAPVSTDWVAVSLAGALFPLLIGALAFGRAAPPRPSSLGWFLLFLTVEAAVLLLLVLPLASPIVRALDVGGIGTAAAQIVLVTLVASIFAILALASAGAGTGLGADSRRAVGFTLALTGAVLASTFAASAAIPGVGIVEQFPEYLLPPIGAGIVAVAVAPRLFPGREALALPVAYFAATFGVLLGADLLRQPPLYGTGPSGLYTIGGAGIFDLVYLSGLLAFGSAYVVHRWSGRDLRPAGEPAPPSRPSPIGLLGASFRSGVRGDLPTSIATSDLASREAAAQAHRLLELPEAPADRPWQGLPVPGWVVADQSNLSAIAREGTNDPREGYRAWLTARWLVNLGRELSVRRFATVFGRIVAFLADLGIALVPAVAIWATLVVTTPGNLIDLLDNIGFNAAIYGFVAVAFLYLVLAETLYGTTPGKWLLGLVVRDRHMRTPSFAASLVRNVSLLPLLTIAALGGALAVAFGLRASTLGTLVLDGIALPVGVFALASVVVFVLGGIGLLGAVGALVIAVSSEHQRIGDLWAGTWVVRRVPDRARYGAPTAAPAPPSSPAPTRPS
jgi:uncharacterized RDD family membrane protein YckC